MRGAVAVDPDVAEVLAEPVLHILPDIGCNGMPPEVTTSRTGDRSSSISAAAPAFPTALHPETPAGPATSNLPDSAALSESADFDPSIREALGRQLESPSGSLSCARMVASLSLSPRFKGLGLP